MTSQMTPGSERTVDYLIVGGGLAGATAAAEIRKRDASGTILLVTRERYLPYHRPPLSKEYVRGEIQAEGVYGEGGVFVQQPGWYDEQGVEVLADIEATALDATAKTVSLSDGGTVHFGALLLATGARPRPLAIPGADLPGVHLLRTLDDADAIREELEPGRRAVIVGAGFIGLEVGASAITKGLHATIVGPEPRVWPSLLSPELSPYFQDQFTKRGAAWRLGSLPVRFIAGEDGRLAAVEVAPAGPGGGQQGQVERIACDLAVVGVGVQLNAELAAGAGLEVDPRHGIVVDERLETRVAGIFAAGDLAAYPDPIAGRMHFEHWDNAIASATAAAANMAGGDEPYRHVPYFFSDQFTLSLNMLGYPSADAEVVVRGDTGADKFTALYVRDGALRAALMVNDDADMDLVRELIAASAQAPHPASRLADPAFDLASLLMPRGRSRGGAHGASEH